VPWSLEEETFSTKALKPASQPASQPAMPPSPRVTRLTTHINQLPSGFSLTPPRVSYSPGYGSGGGGKKNPMYGSDAVCIHNRCGFSYSPPASPTARKRSRSLSASSAKSPAKKRARRAAAVAPGERRKSQRLAAKKKPVYKV